MKKSISELVHESAARLYESGLIDTVTMREFQALKIKPVKPLSPAQIKTLRRRQKVSQSVLAKLLNVSQSAVKQWEMGQRRPTGSALKLLHLIKKNGIQIVL